MVSQTNEQALEALIEKTLTGLCKEEMTANQVREVRLTYNTSHYFAMGFANPMQEIDMVLYINGIALITLELKNLWTGQNARYYG